MFPFERSDYVADPAGFSIEMMRQAKARPKLIREMALRDCCDADAKRGEETVSITSSGTCATARPEGTSSIPVFADEQRQKIEREEAVEDRRAQIRLVEHADE